LSKNNRIVQLALDDVDSPNYGCTTFSLSMIIKALLEKKTEFLDYPRLVRLNPNIPWKTRGNGAVSIIVKCNDPESVFEIAKKIVYQHYLGAERKSTPAIVMHEGEQIESDLERFSEEALYKVMSVKKTMVLLDQYHLKYQTYGGQIGLIGALAGLACPLIDHTYEIIGYRINQNLSKVRKVDPESIIEMSNKTYPFTYNNYDPLTRRILITPHGPDPILFGIRGIEPSKLIGAYRYLKIKEKLSHYVIFKTNQGTNAHLKHYFKIKDIKPYYSVKVQGNVKDSPNIKEGGHVFFALEDKTASIICAAYEPTKTFRNTILELRSGDQIEVGGGIRPPTKKDPLALNIEYLTILYLAEEYKYENPICPTCNRHMKSLGKKQGYKCEKCKTKILQTQKNKKLIPRNIDKGLYLPPPSAHRHLTKPQQYYDTNLQTNPPFNKNFFKIF
jgi:tRNA(Ile2)-agmatinylcytidine synthase